MLRFAFDFPAIAICLCWMLYLAIELNVRPERYERNVKLLILIFSGTVVGMLTWFSAGALDRVRPLKYDLYIYRVDGVLGFEPSFVLGRLMHESVLFRAVIELCYRGMVTAILVVLAERLTSASWSDFLTAVRTFLLAAYFAPFFYLAIPVAGPGHAFASFPAAAPIIAMHPILIHAPPNGVPSVHMSCALLIVFFCWNHRFARWLAVVFAGLTAIATLATGEHYLLDLLVAVPYTLLVVWLAKGRFGQQVRSDGFGRNVGGKSLVVSGD